MTFTEHRILTFTFAEPFVPSSPVRPVPPWAMEAAEGFGVITASGQLENGKLVSLVMTQGPGTDDADYQKALAEARRIFASSMPEEP